MKNRDLRFEVIFFFYIKGENLYIVVTLNLKVKVKFMYLTTDYTINNFVVYQIQKFIILT